MATATYLEGVSHERDDLSEVLQLRLEAEPEGEQGAVQQAVEAKEDDVASSGVVDDGREAGDEAGPRHLEHGRHDPPRVGRLQWRLVEALAMELAANLPHQIEHFDPVQE